MPATYDIDDSVLLTFTVKTLVGGVLTLTNATVTLTLTKPDGTNPAASVSNPSTGVYQATVVPDQAGEWLYRWKATGTANTAEDGAFLVEPNLAGMLYTTVPELRDRLGDDKATLDPGRLEGAIRAASRAIDGRCGRRFFMDPTAVVRTLRPDAPCWTYTKDIATKTGLVVKVDTGGDGTFATTWATGTDFQLEPLDADADGGAYRWNKLVTLGGQRFPPLWDNRPSLQVTARWGWSRVPDDVREAALLKSEHLWKRADAPFGVAGVGDFGPIRIGGREDGDVERLLMPYVLSHGFA